VLAARVTPGAPRPRGAATRHVRALGLFRTVADQPDGALTLSYAQIYLGGLGLLFLSLFLPSIVLAWTLPEESNPDE
jgi:hypothetical protein